MAKEYNGNKNNHYCVVRFYPKRMSDTTLFLFQGGRHFTEKDMRMYIAWLLGKNRLFIDEIEYRVPYSRCKELLENDEYVEWNTCSRAWFKQVKESWNKKPVEV